jgi:hypothetical protein
MPSTIARSSSAVQRTWSSTHESAVDEYGEGERAHRTAYAALKHSFEKVGDHWQAKKQRGPSDPRARRSGQAAHEGKGETFGGLDYNGHTKAELADRARKRGIGGRSKMSKKELAEAIARKQ